MFSTLKNEKLPYAKAAKPFCDFLLCTALGNQSRVQDEKIFSAPQIRRKPMYGCAKDKIWIADDFDAPMDDFKEYI